MVKYGLLSETVIRLSIMLDEELSGRIYSLFNAEVDEDGNVPREFPHDRIIKHHALDISYMKSFAPEGTTTHPYTRRCSKDDIELHAIDRNMDTPTRLFLAALKLFGDSVLEYDGVKERRGDLRFYPPVILTFWSGFEAFVRYTSELLVITVPGIPETVKNYLQEQEVFIDDKGDIKTKRKYSAVLYRYSLLLKYGYKFNRDKGAAYWQNLKNAQELRDYYTHVAIRESKAITSRDVVNYLEAVLMAIITPSCLLQRTLMLNVYYLYDTWAGLADVVEEFSEQSFFHDKPFKEGYLFHCNFEDVDADRFPNWREERREENVPAEPSTH
jgi:hypothetical protein